METFKEHLLRNLGYVFCVSERSPIAIYSDYPVPSGRDTPPSSARKRRELHQSSGLIASLHPTRNIDFPAGAGSVNTSNASAEANYDGSSVPLSMNFAG